MPDSKTKSQSASRRTKLKSTIQKSKAQVNSEKVTARAAKPKAVEKPVKKIGGLTVPVYTLEGEESGSLDLPEVVFGGKVNKALLAQAVRVYLNNQTAHFGHTKTRSEVRGSTAKIRVQKGTGGARHGSKRAPIFVHGGIALGPKFRKVILDLPKKMKQAALKSALSAKAASGEVAGVSGLEKVDGKTKQIRLFLKGISKKDILLVTEARNDKLQRAVRNLGGLNMVVFDQLNTLEVLKHQTLLFTREAVEKLESRIMNHKSGRKEEKE